MLKLIHRVRPRHKTLSLLIALGLSLAFPACEPAQETMVAGHDTQQAISGMVVSQNIIASKVGAEILRAGGNAVDAAIAAGFALAVVHPSAGNIGGGGFMMIRFPDGRSTALDFREKAPLAAHPEMFLDENGEYSSTLHHNSYLAVGVPGTVAGFALAHERYGSESWADLVEPAVRGGVHPYGIPGAVLPVCGPGHGALSGQRREIHQGW
jgi:gamma-glutamyltranspeptidase/glutathione hydrolase